MAISNSITWPVEKVYVGEGRQRSKLENIEELCTSIALNGQLMPIIVEPDGKLVAGERRLTAIRKLGYPGIEVRLVSDLSPLELQAIELDENIRRDDLPWQDVAKAVWNYHRTAQSMFTSWSQERTAETIGQSQSLVSKYLLVAESMDDQRVGGAATLVTAAQQAVRLAQRKQEQDSNRLLDSVSEIFKPAAPAQPVTNTVTPSQAPTPSSSADTDAARHIINASFIDWAESYSGAPFNLLHCDFPYGINFQDSAQGGAASRPLYDDTPEVYFRLIETLLHHRRKLISENAAVIFWLSMNFFDQTRAMFREAGATVAVNPLIWYKSDNKGIAPDTQRLPRHVYESALLIRFGDPKIAKVKADLYAAPTVREANAHASEKPQPMLQHFFEMYVDEYTRMLDPTCGSGSSVRAALALGAETVIGIEMDPTFAEVSRGRLADQLRKARLAKDLKL